MTFPVDTSKPLTRRERRIERQRTQRMPSAGRSTYRTSGTPLMARNGLASPDAAIYLTDRSR